MDKLIFIVDDQAPILRLITYWVGEKWNYKVKTFDTAEQMLASLQLKPDLILLDIMLPGISGIEALKEIKKFDHRLPVIMLSAQGRVDVALEALKLGAYDYFPKPIDTQRLEPAIRNALKNYDLEKELERARENVSQTYSFSNIISADDKMQEVFKLMTKVLDNDITVLIHGESGTGKELIAKAIHFNGIRKELPFVVVNCASIPRDLMESELFGHEKGSFTGAHQRKLGKFELADKGTLFLDEVGEMDIGLQSKLLRAIQQKEFERVGGTESIKCDVRIISATNRDLKQAVDEKLFREDLFYRLNSFPIILPPLRERRSDIIVLAKHFVEHFNKKHNKNVQGFSSKATRLMFDYDWPGNIREMENTIERSLILTENDKIEAEDLPPHIRALSNAALNISNDGQLNTENTLPFEKIKELAIRNAIKVTKGNIFEAAKKLELGRATIYRLMAKYNIDPENP
ncbi:MAG: sigma-54 dependent transcriptional regulator [Ignavibacteriales bacterium]|nr:MAG: sigma-54-dependent Fis family transcriptional regulator [Ignavibacteriaceae bacterium]MBW7874251.1 sigma-54-dependent Fis family transcriptional regulator [Ignavibacteria bacterium]MCZ2143248.1 sigma-54 dependent transcriptional regulator [Ignavibacteriales bacterium]MBV6444128.1 Regulatory protein AtoC [Ignavibacteriaceae bacterium]MBZ0196146.1 sigma-54 dependent transcriptional regulator [Ignavibacteriaceae bacterium]